MRLFSKISVFFCVSIFLLQIGCSGGDASAVNATSSSDNTDTTDNANSTTEDDTADGTDTADTSDGLDTTDGSSEANTSATDSADGADQSNATESDASDGVDTADSTGTDASDGPSVCAADGICDADAGETFDNCPDDCTCGNGICDATETYDDCPADCICGNSVCDEGEDNITCPEDCSCGDGVCDDTKGEDAASCALDCSCDAVNGCAQEPTMPVCYNGSEFFPNFCYAQCAHPEDALDLSLPYSPDTCTVELNCQDPACNPAWVDQQPVCWQSGAQNQSYSDPYAACCDGHNWLTDSDVFPGECGGGSNFTCSEASACPPTEQLVCGTLDGTDQTFQNLCDFSLCADNDGSGPVLECSAPCGAHYNCPACAENDACELVCGADGTTYRNSCYAACAGIQVESIGECCDCPEPSANQQVCGDDGTTYGSECLLGCADAVLPAYVGPCVEGCSPAPDDEAACGFYNGAFTTFANAACAQAAGATCVYDGDCAPGTFNPCPLSDPYYAPVCAAVPGGQLDSYPNACFAGCAGASVEYAGLCDECTTSATLCPPEATTDAQPTCVVEECVLYPNECYPKKCTGNAESTLQKFTCPQNCGELEE